MANTTIDAAVAEITRDTSVISSATSLINGFQGRMQAAVDAALAGGATAADLQPITDQLAIEKSGADALATAVAANTPAAPTP